MWLFFILGVNVGAGLKPTTTAQLTDIEILKSDRTGIEFVYTPGQNTVPQPEPGKPNVPVRYITIGVPVGAEVKVRVIESITAESSGIYIPPTYGFIHNERDEDIYSTDAYWPTQVISIEEQSLYRAQEVVKLRINPFRYNPVRELLLVYKKLRIRVDFYGGGGVPRIDKHFDPVFKSVLINYEQAKNWRAPKIHKPHVYHPGPWYKIELQEEGIYKIDKEQLKSIGIKNVDPNTIKIYNGGSKMITNSLDTLKEIPICVLSDTSILFYGTSLNGWGKNGKAFLNPYTNTNVYWLTYGGSPGRRDSISGELSPDLPIDEWFIDTVHIERDELCPAKSGLGWVWERHERLKDVESIKKDYSFDIHSLMSDSCNIRFAVYGWHADGRNQAESNNMLHNIRAYLNGTAFFDTSWKKGDSWPRIFERRVTGLKQGTNVFTFELYKGEAINRDIVFFDWFEVIYKNKYIAYNGNLKFKGTKVEQKFELNGFNELPVIFEITDPINPKLIYAAVYEDGVVKFKGGNADYFASSNFKTPALKKESPYSLRNHTAPVDLIIITHPDFIDYANTLKTHREKQGLRTMVANVEEVYNNFSWGLRHSPYAIKNFLGFAYNNWEVSYCLLLGAGTYAYRNETLPKNRIPPYEEGYKVGEYGYPPADQSCYDWWYTDRNFTIGRITASSKEEARDVIAEKIIKYEQNPGIWQNRILLIADDERRPDGGDGNQFPAYMEALQNIIPQEYDVFKVYLMNYPYRDPEARTARFDLIKNWSKGQFLNFYAGHGNLLQLCHEVAFYNPRDIEALYNGIKLPFTHFSSCGVGCFEREYKDGMADYLQKIKGKGSIGTIGETRVSTLHQEIARGIIEFSLVEPQRTIGLVIYSTNLAYPLPANCNLFADPATLLPLRTIEVKIDSFADTLRGGKVLKLWGHAEGAKFAYITVMSSEYTYTYYYSGGFCQYKMRGRMINEQLCEDILFEGITKVDNGKFYHEFFIPVEIDTLLCGENGKISVFAWNDSSCGSSAVQATIVKGEPNPEDSVGPRIELYANGKILKDGELVPSDFMLTGVLEDESGINTVNKILPYNLALMLQVNSGDFVPLADYFQYDIGSGRRGSFNYQLKLDPRDTEDTLTVQASDNLGNRNVHKVVVKIVSSARLEIRRIINYPNPVRGEHTTFTFFLSKPAMVKVKIYTISGRLIRTIPLQNKMPGLNQIYWDTRDELGNRVGNGIYIYKIYAISEGISKEETEEVSKLMILR